jgi:hypothetical protein
MAEMFVPMDRMIDTEISSLQAKNKFVGNILLFYAFDIGDDIDLGVIKHKNLVNTCVVPLSTYFKNYHIPLSFRMMGDEAGEKEQTVTGSSCISSKIYHFGVLSYCYRIPFQDTFEDLKLKILDIKKSFDEKSDVDARNTFKAIYPSIKKPRFYSLKNSYFAVQVHPLKDKVTPEEFKERYGSKIASLLRLEIYNLSDYQKDQILESTTGYYGQDLIIIDSEASFIYDDEYFEPLEFFESANIQKLELQYFDRLLDQKLNYFYNQETYKVPLKAYIPLASERLDLPVSRLANLRVDISVVTERLENSIKLAGDAYYTNLYAILVEKLSLKEWRDSINRKLSIIHDLYTVHQDRLDTLHDEILTVVVIVLIGLEALALFFK